MRKYHSGVVSEPQKAAKAPDSGGQAQHPAEANDPQQSEPNKAKKPTEKKSGGAGMNPVPPSRRHMPTSPTQEVNANEQT